MTSCTCEPRRVVHLLRFSNPTNPLLSYEDLYNHHSQASPQHIAAAAHTFSELRRTRTWTLKFVRCNKFSETLLPKASPMDLCFVFVPGQAFPLFSFKISMIHNIVKYVSSSINIQITILRSGLSFKC